MERGGFGKIVEEIERALDSKAEWSDIACLSVDCSNDYFATKKAKPEGCPDKVEPLSTVSSSSS